MATSRTRTTSKSASRNSHKTRSSYNLPLDMPIHENQERHNRHNMSFFRRLRVMQLGGRAITHTTQLPLELLADCERRLGIEKSTGIPSLVYDMSLASTQLLAPNCKSTEHSRTCLKNLKDMIKKLQEQNDMEEPANCIESNENKVKCAELFYLFGGVDVVVGILLQPYYFPLKDTANRSETEKWKKLAFRCLELLHGMFLSMGTDIGAHLGENHDLIFHLFSLIADKSCFLKAATLLEDILSSRNKTFKLDELVDLQSLVQNCSDEQIANSCRVLSIAVSEFESKDHNHTLAAQDKALRSRKDAPISEVNQQILVELPNFVQKLVEIACQRIEYSPASNPQHLFSEIENWVTWLDNSMAFDALAEVVNDEDGVYLNLPINDIAIPQSLKRMHQVVYKVEVLYVLCLLLGGKQRQKVQDMVSNFRLMPGLNAIFDHVIWACILRTPIHTAHENCNCSPEVAFKVQFLRLVHTFCDHHDNKYLLLTKNEITSLEKICHAANIPVIEAVQNVDRSKLCTGNKGIISKLVDVIKKEPADSPFRFWLARAVESFLRGKTSFADQTFLLKKGLLEHIVTHMLEEENKSKEVIQSYFDLLAELMKFNIIAYQKFNRVITNDEKFKQFMALVHSNIVDSNMFIRNLALSLEHFDKEQRENHDWALQNCRLIQFITKRENRLMYLFKLINTINVEILTQENVSCLNTTIIFLMFADRIGQMPRYLEDLRGEEQRECKPGFLLQNFRELLIFWQEHYLHKEKDCTALEKGSCIRFSKWKETVSTLIGTNTKSPYTVAHYLEIDHLFSSEILMDTSEMPRRDN